MPIVKVAGKIRHFPYTEKGKALAKKALGVAKTIMKKTNIPTSDGFMRSKKLGTFSQLRNGYLER